MSALPTKLDHLGATNDMVLPRIDGWQDQQVSDTYSLDMLSRMRRSKQKLDAECRSAPVGLRHGERVSRFLRVTAISIRTRTGFGRDDEQHGLDLTSRKG